jgi:5'-nucleotidase
VTRILITNDDGITSPGLHALYLALVELGEVTIVAPDAEQSAVGHAITTLTPLRIKQVTLADGIVGHAVNGTPADSVRLAILSICSDPPDLVVSGINLGPNVATNVIYSGTVSAATEARILRIPSIAVSLATFKDPIWETPAAFARQLAADVLAHGLPDKVLLNINVPNIPIDKVKGIRVTRQGNSGYKERYEMRSDPRAVPYYWQAGTYSMTDLDEETDALAVDQGYVSVTPVTFDLTAYDFLPALSRRLARD